MAFNMGPVMEFLDFVSSIILPIAGSVVTYSEVRGARMEKKTREFQLAMELSPEDRDIYANQALDFYRRRYAAEIKAGTLSARHLVAPAAWLQSPKSDRFIPLAEIPVTVSHTVWDRPSPDPKWLPYRKEGFAANRKAFLSGGKLFNGRLYALEAARGDLNAGDLALTVKTGGYFDFLDTCEYLGYEMSYVRKVRRIKATPELQELPFRRSQADLLDLDNRFAGIGCNCAAIFHGLREEDGSCGSYLLMHYRASKGISEGIGAVHVAPAGSHQPVGKDIRSDFNRNLANTIYREFAEELLGAEEFYYLEDESMLDQRYCRWPLDTLGFGFEPFNTKLEVLCAMQVDMGDPENRALFGGADTRDKLQKFFKSNYEGDLRLIPLKTGVLHQYEQDPRTVPPCKEILAILLEHKSHFGIR